MGTPKLHHYVPQFHLGRFADDRGLLWLWDREADRVIRANPHRVAAEKNFYYLDQFRVVGRDPLTMEKQLADLEGEVALITTQWLGWLRSIPRGEKIPIPRINRKIVSNFIALQFLRTADTRDTLAALIEDDTGIPLSPMKRRVAHTELIWDDAVLGKLASRIRRSSWIFARNETATPFITSDNPVAFRTGDNARWRKAGVYEAQTYVVFPLAPDLMMYCHPREGRHKALRPFDRTLSPVVFSDEMVEAENSGQVFMASRFVISCRADFSFERAFASTIGTDTYREGWLIRGASDWHAT